MPAHDSLLKNFQISANVLYFVVFKKARNRVQDSGISSAGSPAPGFILERGFTD
jgi:hypothetical protein